MVSAETRLASHQVKHKLLDQSKQPLYGYMDGKGDKKRRTATEPAERESKRRQVSGHMAVDAA
eukprot:11742519-Karenia_brevis.AAC.1